jgi:hypothetical protein
MRAIETCRTPALGGIVEWCDHLWLHCQYTHTRYRSCRNRHCPKCQGAAREKWLEQRRAELLPTTYFHVVFTLPELIAAIAFYNQEVVYSLPLPRHRRNPAHHRRRPQTSRRGDGLFRGASYLGPEPSLSSSPALRRSRRRPVPGSQPMDERPPPLLSSGPSAQPPFPPSLPGGSGRSLCRRQTPVLRRSATLTRPASLYPLPGPMEKERLGSLRQGSLRRTATGAGVSRPLHPSRGHFQPPPAAVARGPGLFPVEGLPRRQPLEGDDRFRRRVHPPLPAACASAKPHAKQNRGKHV